MRVALSTAVLQVDLKDKKETPAIREKQVDQGCQERKEILVPWAALEILVPLVTVE